MKVSIRISCCVAILAVSCVLKVFGQGCYMQPSYDSYQSETTDGTNIYTSVLVDGYGNCDSSYCACGSAVHTPKAYNVIGGIGGEGSGAGACPNCYISYENDQSILATQGVPYWWQADTEVNCSVVGAFYGEEFPGIYLSIAFTHVITTGYISAGYCPTTPYCGIGVTPVCNITSVREYDPACYPAYDCTSLAVSFYLGGPYTCEINACPPSTNTGAGPCTGQQTA